MSSLWHAFADMSIVQDSPFVVTRGEGCYVWDNQGNRYLDGTAGLWFANLGYGRTEIAQAVDRQMREIFAYHNFTDYVTQPTIDLADEIARHAPTRPRRCSSPAADPTRSTRRESWSGATTSSPVRRSGPCSSPGNGRITGCTPTEPRSPGSSPTAAATAIWCPMSSLVPHDDTEAIEKAIDHAGPERIAGIFCEPVIGAGGVRPVPVDYLHTARDLVRAAGGSSSPTRSSPVSVGSAIGSPPPASTSTPT